MQSLSTFIRTSGPIPEMQKPALINDWQNLADLAKQGIGKQVWFVSNTVGGSEEES